MAPVIIPPSARGQSQGNAEACRQAAASCKKAAHKLQSICDDCEHALYFYSGDWEGGWKEQLLASWGKYVTANGQLTSGAWAADRASFVKANPRLAHQYEGRDGPTVFRQAIDACHQASAWLESCAQAIDQQQAQQTEMAIDAGIIALSIVGTVVTLGVLAPEAAVLDVAVVGGTLTAGAGDVGKQMGSNMGGDHDSVG